MSENVQEISPDKKLYNNLTSDGYKLGSYDQFSSNLQDDSKRKKFYDNLNSDGYKLGDYDSFSSKIKKTNSIPSFNPVENVTNSVKDKIKPPRDIYSNLTPSDNGNMPFVSTVKGTEQEQQKSEQELANKVEKGNLNILTPEERKQHSFNQAVKSVWTTLLTDPSAKDEKTREDFYKLYEKDFDKYQIENIKKVGDEAANLQLGYEQVRQQAHDNPNPDNYSLLGQYQAAAGDMTTANKTFNYLIKTYPDRSEGYVGNAYLAYKHGDIKTAIGFTNQALKNNPDDVNALTKRASYETINGNPQDAAIDADKAVKNAKYGTDESVTAYQTRAQVYKASGKNDLAAQDEATANAMTVAMKEKPKKDLENKFKGEYEADLKQRRAEGIPVESDKGTEYESLDKFIPFRRQNIKENIAEEENIKKTPISSVVGGLFNDPVTHTPTIASGLVESTAQGVAQTGRGIGYIASGDVLKGVLKAGLGVAHTVFGLANLTPAGAEFNTGVNVGEQVAPDLTKYLMNPFTTTFDPKTETERNVAELGDILTNLLVMRRIGQGVEGFKTGLSEAKPIVPDIQHPDKAKPFEEIKLSDQADVEVKDKKGNVIFKQTPITPDQAVESKLNDYKENNKKFLDNLKKRNLDQYNSTIASAKARFENQVKPKVTNEELKLKSVEDKILNKQSFTPSDVETLHNFVDNLSPDEIKQAAQNLPEKPVEKAKSNKQPIVKEDEQNVVNKKPEVNESDKVNSDLTRLQSRLGKAAENKKVGIQKQIDAKNKQVEELKNKPVEEKKSEVVGKPADDKPIPTVTPEVSEDGIINNRDNKGIEDALDKGEKVDNTRPLIINENKSFENRTDKEHSDFIKDKFLNVFTYKGVPKEQVQAAISLMDARAKKYNPENPHSWFRQIQDIGTGKFQTPDIKYQGEWKKMLLGGILNVLPFHAEDFSYKFNKPDINIESKSDKINKTDSILDEKQKKLAPESDSIRKQTIEVKDNRSIDSVTGKNISAKQKHGAKTDKGTVLDIVRSSIDYGNDPYTMLAISLNETNLGGGDEGNYFHVLNPDGTAAILGDSSLSPLEQGQILFKQKMNIAKKRGKVNESDKIQAFNGYGKLGEHTEGENKSFYGIDVTEGKSIDMDTNPVYGKRIIDLRENIIKKNPEIRKIVEQEQKTWGKKSIKYQQGKGALETLESGKKIIHALESPDFSTTIHEIAHLFEDELNPQERKIITDWSKEKKWTTVTSEKFATAFEKYLKDGIAPTDELKSVFDKAKEWLGKIYNGIKNTVTGTKIPKDVKNVFDNLFAPDVIKRNTKLPKDSYIEGNETDIKFSADKTVKGKNVLAPPSEPHYIDNKDNPKNFLAGAKRSRLVRPQPEGETQPEKLIQGETAHEGAPVANWRGEAIQGDGRLARINDMLKKDTYIKALNERKADIEESDLSPEEKEKLKGKVENSLQKAYYDALRKNKKELGFTDEQINTAKKNGWVYQRFINAGHDEAANLSQKDERDLLTHDAADLAADKIKTLTPGQVDNFAHLFDGRPLEDILQNDGVKILHALNEAGVISDLTTERMKIGNTINPTFIPHLVDVFRSVITGDVGNNEIPVRDYYNNAPDLIKHSLDRIIPEILKLPTDKRPNEYIQKALVVLGNKGDVPTREFVENLQNASDLDKAFIPFVLDPVSKHTIPALIRDYKLQLQGVDYEGQKPMTMSDAMGHLFLENDNNTLNEKERETQDVERGTEVQSNQQGTSGKETGTGTNEDNRTAGQKIADKVFGILPVIEKISDLPDNLPITQNSVLGNIITGVRGAYRRLAKLDNRDASHAISYFHNERTGTDKAMNLYSVQSLEQLNNADPETNLYENKSKVYKHFDELERASNLGLPEPDFKADNNAQQILYDFTNAIKGRTDRLVDELKDVQGLPDSYLDLVKESTKGFLHRMLGEHYVPMDIAKERESREAEIQAYKEGRKELKDIGGVRGLFKQTMAEEQVKPKYKGFLGNDNSDIFEPRKTLEAVDKKTGEKAIVEFQEGGKVVRWKDGTPTTIGEYKDLPSIRKKNSFTDKKGNEYSLNDGLVSDIKRETGKNYIEHPVLSAIEGLRSLSKIHSTVKFFQSIKNAPEVSQFMKVLNKEQLDIIQNIKSASLKENSTVGLQSLIDEHNSGVGKPSAKNPIQVLNPKQVIEYADTDTPNDLTNKLLAANNMPENFLNEFQAAKGIIKHPIFDDTYFKRNALESIQNSLMDDKPKNSELIRGYLNWVYLGIEGTGHALNLATNTAINTAAEIAGGNFEGLGNSFTEAEKAIREQNDTHKYFQSHGVSNFFNVNPDYTEAVVSILKQNIADNPEKNKPLNEAIANMASDYKEGFKDLKNFGSKVNRSLIWWLNDMNVYSTILKEASNQGLDVKNIDFNNPDHTAKLDNAIKVSAQNYNSYHIASEELAGGKAGRIIADGLRNRGVFIFTNYFVGNIKVFAGQAKQLREGFSRGADDNQVRRANTAVDRIAVGAAMLYGIQKFENWRNKDKSDVYHEENRPGLLRIPYEVQRFSKGQINIGELATKIIHPIPFLMNFPNWVKNQNGLGGVNDPNGNIFSVDGFDYLMNGASIPKVNQQTAGDKINDFLKARSGLEYDVKMSPDEHGLVTQLRNFNEFIGPEMKAITKSLQQYHKKLNSGQPIEIEDRIDETGYNNFLQKAYYSSGNILNHWEDYTHQRISELQNSDTTSDVNKKLWIERYQQMLPKIDIIKAKNKEYFDEYMKNKNDTSAYKEGMHLKEIGKIIKVQ